MITATNLFLIAVIVALLAVVLVLAAINVRFTTDIQRDHAQCIAQVTEYTGNEFAARVLLAAAEDYNSGDGRVELALLRRDWTGSDHDSIPAAWLRNRADRIREKESA